MALTLDLAMNDHGTCLSLETPQPCCCVHGLDTRGCFNGRKEPISVRRSGRGWPSNPLNWGFLSIIRGRNRFNKRIIVLVWRSGIAPPGRWGKSLSATTHPISLSFNWTWLHRGMMQIVLTRRLSSSKKPWSISVTPLQPWRMKYLGNFGSDSDHRFPYQTTCV